MRFQLKKKMIHRVRMLISFYVTCIHSVTCVPDAQVKSDIEEEYLTWQTEKKSIEENEICLQSKLNWGNQCNVWCEMNCVGIKISPILQKRGRPKGHEVTVVGLPSKNSKSTKPKPFAKLHTSITENSRFSLPVVVV